MHAGSLRFKYRTTEKRSNFLSSDFLWSYFVHNFYFMTIVSDVWFNFNFGEPSHLLEKRKFDFLQKYANNDNIVIIIIII